MARRCLSDDMRNCCHGLFGAAELLPTFPRELFMTNIIQFPRGMNTPDKPREVIRESWVRTVDIPICPWTHVENCIQYKATSMWEGEE